MIEFKEEIKQVISSETKLLFVKVPDNLKDLLVDNINNIIKGYVENEIWVSKNLPKKIYNFIGYSHNLTEKEIENIFVSRDKFYQILKHNDIFYNYSQYSGKWAILIKILDNK